MAAATKKAADAMGVEAMAREAPVRSGVDASLMAVLELEDEAREAGSVAELLVLAANQTLRLAGARQVFVLRYGLRRPEVAAVSSLSTFDPHAPLVQAVERAVEKLAADAGAEGMREFEAQAYASQHDTILEAYPFRWLMWMPLVTRGHRQLGGLLLARETPWSKSDGVVIQRVARIVAHAWRGLDAEGRLSPRIRTNRWTMAALLTAAALLLLVPVPMTTLAPFEVGSRDEFVVAAPIDGVIEAIDVEPNAAVVQGQMLVRLSGTQHANKLEIAEREVAVAAARLIKTEQLAFADARGRHDIGVARTELALRTAERDYAKDLFAKTGIRASRDGLAVFTDKRDLIGRPVTTGERILHIADPKTPEIRIDVPVSDAMILQPQAPVKVFLDSDPLRPRSGVVRQADYLARVRSDVLAFRAVADLGDDPGVVPPRLGARGTAQLFGDPVPLGFYLFRRPISALRQRIGL